VGHGFSFLFGMPFRWGLVIACGLLVAICGASGLIHDLRLEVSPPHAPPREHD
jgi:hypothetical protein